VFEPNPVAQTETDDVTVEERRAWVRYPCDWESACKPIAGPSKDRWPGKIRNLSRGGIGLSLNRRFEVGAVLAIEVEGKADEILGTVLARVAHVVQQDDGSWFHGCAFTKLLGEGELTALL
jgi:hypothetical protein